MYLDLTAPFWISLLLYLTVSICLFASVCIISQLTDCIVSQLISMTLSWPILCWTFICVLRARRAGARMQMVMCVRRAKQMVKSLIMLGGGPDDGLLITPRLNKVSRGST